MVTGNLNKIVVTGKSPQDGGDRVMSQDGGDRVMSQDGGDGECHRMA